MSIFEEAKKEFERKQRNQKKSFESSKRNFREKHNSFNWKKKTKL